MPQTRASGCLALYVYMQFVLQTQHIPLSTYLCTCTCHEHTHTHTERERERERERPEYRISARMSGGSEGADASQGSPAHTHRYPNVSRAHLLYDRSLLTQSITSRAHLPHVRCPYIPYGQFTNWKWTLTPYNGTHFTAPTIKQIVVKSMLFTNARG